MKLSNHMKTIFDEERRFMKVIGLKITSKIFFNNEIDSTKAKQIMEDIENKIISFAQEKFNACVGGTGEFIKEDDL
ncbi:hypothetical protein KQI61_06005 [Anaerocolumna aminovalerica]|uniref:hypothetical protein n=1 Tax=Anaerocolumna aminovalerica TaxID=1527 RepID=UPI001C0EDA61|nr:hypothetical protein [Anaerocolumna aminovalerica]MBU5331744.1 hypothetical protein [Anaerocolumna aminovalerica]